MKNAPKFFALMMMLVFAAPQAWAATAAAPAQDPAAAAAAAATRTHAQAQEQQKVEDILKDITIYPRPEDFATAQKLAIQNREERLDLVHKAIECVQHSKSINDIYNCQNEERKALDRVWLSYCNTTLSFLNGVRKMPKPGQDPGSLPRTADCERALAAVTGKPQPKFNNQQQQQQQQDGSDAQQ